MLTNFRAVFGTTGNVEFDMMLTVIFSITILLTLFRVFHDIINK